MLTQREYDEDELATMRRRLRDVEDPGRQVSPSPAGQEFRQSLRDDIARIEARLSEDE